MESLGKILREFSESHFFWQEKPTPRHIVASPQFLKNVIDKFPNGFESFLNDLEVLMDKHGIAQIYLSQQHWEVLYDLLEKS